MLTVLYICCRPYIGFYFLMVVWVWSEVSFLGFYFFRWTGSDVPVAYLIMSLYYLHVGCLWGGFPASGGVGGFTCLVFWFSGMVSCVGHFGNVVVGWVSAS